MRAGAPRRVFGYCRVSSAGQEKSGTSLEGQRDEITRWCAAQGYPAPTLAVEVESGSAEKIERRVEQVRLTAEAQSGDVVVVVAVDRWSRDIVHAVSSVRALVARGVRWCSIREALDAATPHGDSTLGIMSWTADQERRRIRERTVGRRRELTDAGLYVLGRVPIGYKAEARRLHVVPEEADLVRGIFERCADGESMPEIAATLPPVRSRTRWTVHAVHRILKCRYVLGEARQSDGTWTPDTHPAIVDRDLWERAHAAARKRVSGGRKYATGESSVRLLRGLAVCSACGRKVSVRFGAKHQRADPGGSHAHYYICRGSLAHECKEGWIRAHDVDEEAAALAVARLVDLREELARPATAAAPRKPHDATATLARIEVRKRNAIDLATDGAMDAKQLRAALARLDEEAAKVRRQADDEAREAAAAERAADPKRRAALLRDARTWRDGWAKMDVATRRVVLAALAVRVEVGRRGVRCVWRSAADLAGVAEKRTVT